MGPLGWLDVVDRDGLPRQSFAVREWPLRVGRAFDNDLVLADPHIAPHHLTIAPAESGLTLTLADTRNGVRLGRKHLRAGESALLAPDGDAIDFHAGRTHLRLRLPGQALAAELPLAPTTTLARRVWPVLIAALALVGGMLFTTWLDTDPENLQRAAGTALLTGLLGAAAWCTVWALMSKTFTRQARFGWHVRVFVFASLALMLVTALAAWLAFAFSWPTLTDFAFIGTIAVTAFALYFHLLAVEPAKHHVFKWATTACAVAGVLLSLWFNLQRSDQFGDELYMSHLLAPMLRVARPVSTDAFIAGLASLKATLDEKAKEPARGDETGRPDEE